MAALVLKNLPDRLHKRLKKEAQRNRRSMAQQAITILERSLLDVSPIVLPEKPIKPVRPITRKMVLASIRAGRK